LRTAEERYRRYSHAVRDLAAPRLFENRLCFRVTGLDWTLPVVHFQFGAMGFFDSVDTNEALAHEMALHHASLDIHGNVTVGRGSWRKLAFRKLIGDPFDLSRRPLMGAVGTLTIRAGESPSMVLHQRDGRDLAHRLAAEGRFDVPPNVQLVPDAGGFLQLVDLEPLLKGDSEQGASACVALLVDLGAKPRQNALCFGLVGRGLSEVQPAAGERVHSGVHAHTQRVAPPLDLPLWARPAPCPWHGPGVLAPIVMPIHWPK
jgi:hypothetical protein